MPWAGEDSVGQSIQTTASAPGLPTQKGSIMRKSDNTKPSTYARLERKVGWYDEYSGSPVYYHVGHCDECGLTNVSFSEGYDNKTQGKNFRDGDKWVTWHNQSYHQEATRPVVVAAQPAVSIQMICGHSYAKPARGKGTVYERALSSLGNADGVCGQPLHRYKGDWDYDRPLYVCSFGHHNEVPEAVNRKALNVRVKAVNAHLTDMHEGFGVDAKIAELEARKRELKR